MLDFCYAQHLCGQIEQSYLKFRVVQRIVNWKDGEIGDLKLKMENGK